MTETPLKQVCFSLADLEELEKLSHVTGLRGIALQDEFLFQREEKAREYGVTTTAYPYDTTINGLYFSGRGFASIR